jgi:thymidylate kinase
MEGELILDLSPPAAAPKGMIIELFGPAAVGKTTLAQALAAALRARGVAVRVVASARPSEAKRPGAALMAPLARAAKLFGALGTMMPGSAEQEIRDLMRTLPPAGWLRTLRLRRYGTHLVRSWRAARASDKVVIFDQGFATLLCSLAMLGGPVDRRALTRALSLIPEPDLLVRLTAPGPMIEARLRDRLRRQSAPERLFENDVATSLRQTELSAALDALLSESGRRAMRLSCPDRAALAIAVEAIVAEITSHRQGVAA